MNENEVAGDLTCAMGRALWGGIMFGGMVAGAATGWVILTVWERVSRRVGR